MTTATQGNSVRVHYRGSLEDGTEFDNSYDRGEPIGFTVGAGQMIDGFDSAVVGMKVGDTKTVTLQPGEAYGEVNPEAYTNLSRDAFPDDFPIAEGGQVPLTGPNNEQFMGVIQEFDDKSVKIDLNHRLAGKVLNFDIELVEIGG